MPSSRSAALGALGTLWVATLAGAPIASQGDHFRPTCGPPGCQSWGLTSVSTWLLTLA
ncbi:hypothetical protein Ae717Ps2_6898 [Pseudonocardia sp. Ae717_Ps2]|nr:hypothetical protein Ae717Ps2_6849 [Pseudonocardia sp. Ae717_Ps2]OLM28048.1 hypothetical protein Ae717Ps2_6898 [Pseudonocardia sp. Ae717_Ps2]